ncbi:MAG TPA: glycine cleavage T C-terminal barrel domain-containing protein, partial [Thermoplasmata archaeon]|nr:glycine cleavage T C-terminal barrel domain-containing protein [Thermoplasmata archaeon]
GIPVTISRTGYTGDLGYELWVERDRAEALWDAVMEKGKGHDITPAGMLALDVARIEAGLILAEVEYQPARRAIIDAQRYSPFELSLDWTVALHKGRFIGRKALVAESSRGPARRTVGLEIDWQAIEQHYRNLGLPPQPPSEPWREKVPLYAGYKQVGWATSGCWSPLLKKYIALATVAAPYARIGTRLEIEIAVEWERHRTPATVAKRPFFDPERKKS